MPCYHEVPPPATYHGVLLVSAEERIAAVEAEVVDPRTLTVDIVVDDARDERRNEAERRRRVQAKAGRAERILAVALEVGTETSEHAQIQ